MCRTRATAVLLLLAGDLKGTRVATATPAEPLPRLVSHWVADGSVLAVATAPDVAYIGGTFQSLSPHTGSWVALNRQGRPAATFPQVIGEVNAAVADGRGGWFIGGSFTNVGGVPRRYLAHINTDRTLDRRHVGGDFTTIGGRRQSIAAFNLATGDPTAWKAPIDGTVYALSVRGRTLIAAGTFGYAIFRLTP
jgi:hypothetical protein